MSDEKKIKFKMSWSHDLPLIRLYLKEILLIEQIVREGSVFFTHVPHKGDPDYTDYFYLSALKEMGLTEIEYFNTEMKFGYALSPMGYMLRETGTYKEVMRDQRINILLEDG